jgi:single-stranded DNA-binding protein
LSVRCAVDNDEKTQWISCVIFDAAAIENRAALDKGVRIYCEGKLSLNEWKTDAGEQRHGLSVVSWEFHLAQIGRSRRRSRPKPKPTPAPPLQLEQQASGGAVFDDSIPFAPAVLP